MKELQIKTLREREASWCHNIKKNTTKVCILHTFEHNQSWGGTSMMWQLLNGYEKVEYTIKIFTKLIWIA